ncbi:MAG TPA: hypothetical protein PLR69_10700, partial [Candidatus Limiplasma sp.]|nr:hypothetical protein [Candidatus Limiplasma sp.]
LDEISQLPAYAYAHIRFNRSCRRAFARIIFPCNNNRSLTGMHLIGGYGASFHVEDAFSRSL